MSLARFMVLEAGPGQENALISLTADNARHLIALRLKVGEALEVLLTDGPWRADLASLTRQSATARLVCPVQEEREAPIAIEACLPLTAQLSLWDDWLPPCVELGVSLIQPILYQRSEYDARKTSARYERWTRILLGACEQSHRNVVPVLADPLPFASLLAWPTPQKWVAYELMTDQRNPTLQRDTIAFTHGPEGGITHQEFDALAQAGWQPLSLGKSILRASTCPAAILGAIQSRLY